MVRNGLCAVWMWGLNPSTGDTDAGSVTFKGNTGVNPIGCSFAAIAMAATSYAYENLTFDVQNNTGFSTTYGTSTSCTYNNNTFVEGSETF